MSGWTSDPLQAPVAFGQRAVPRLVLELRDPGTVTRLRALAALCDLLHDPERTSQALTHGCLEQLKVLLKDKEPLIRMKSTEVLHLLAAHNVGREAFLCCDVLSPLSELLDEPVEDCKRNVHRALNRLAHFPSGAAAMVALELVPRLVRKVSEEEDEEVRTLLLSTISQCVRVDGLAALACDAVSVLGQQLSQSSPHIRRAAAAALVGISVPMEGKLKVCEGAVLPVLVCLLSDSDPGVQANAAGTIMNTTVITKGKLQALAAGALVPLLSLVSSRERAVCVNALRALTSLAEAPSARRHLLEHLPQLRSRTGAGEEEIIRRAAETAVRVITWTP